MLPILIGMVALVAEFGFGLLTRVTNQRVADLAAYSGALAYGSSSSTATMNAAMDRIAVLNGVPATAVTGQLVTSPTGSGSQGVSASVSTNQLLVLAPILGRSSQFAVAASAIAEAAPQAGGCIIALSSAGSGVTLSGGTSLTAANCAVSSNSTVSVPCGTTITTKTVTYNSSSVPSQPCGGIQAPAGAGSVSISKKSTADPLAGNAGVLAATARIATVAGQSVPNAPSVSGSPGSIDFGWSQSATQAQATAVGCTATFSGSSWSLTCPSGGTYTFNNITVGGGITVNFNTGGSASTTYRFKGSISNTGTALNFGPGTFTIAGGLTTGGGSTTSFGAGAFNIGQSPNACNGAGRYSICHTGASLSFAGPSTFTLAAGIFNAGGATLTMGSGTANSYHIGPSSTGDAFNLGGGSKTTLADATASGKLFKVSGNINSGGGSCFTLPAAAQHDVDGNLSTAGGTILGAGVYTVDGYVALGANGGGDVNCAGATVGMKGVGVTLVISGSSTPSGGSCSGQAFCLAAGYGNVTLTAPTSGTTAKLVVVGPTSSGNTGGATFAEGASTSLSGAFYFPRGPISLSGGAHIGNGSGQCLQLIGSQISLGGGTAAGSLCFSGSGGSQAAVLVQ